MEDKYEEGEHNCRKVAAASVIHAVRSASMMLDSKAQQCGAAGENLCQPETTESVGSETRGRGKHVKARTTVAVEVTISPDAGEMAVAADTRNRVAAAAAATAAAAAAASPAQLTPDASVQATADARFNTMSPPSSKGDRGEEAPPAIVPLPASPQNAASPAESAQSKNQKKNAKRKAARVRKLERELGASRGMAREEGACSARKRRGWAACIIGNAWKLFCSTKAAPTWTGKALEVPEANATEEASGRQPAALASFDGSVAAGGAGRTTGTREAVPPVPVVGEAGAVETTCDHLVSDSSLRTKATADACFVGGDGRGEAGEPGRGEGRQRAPASLGPSPPAAACRIAVTGSTEERRLTKTAQRREARRRKKELVTEAWRQVPAAPQLGENNVSGHQSVLSSAAEASSVPRHEGETDSECDGRLGRAHPPVLERTSGITSSTRPDSPPGQQRSPATPAVQIVAAACYAYAMARRRPKTMEQKPSCGLDGSVVVGPRAQEIRPMEEGDVLAMKEQVKAGEEKSAQTARANSVLLGMIRQFQKRQADRAAQALAAQIEEAVAPTDAAAVASESTTAAEPEQAAGKAAAEEAERKTLEKMLLDKVKQTLKDRHANAAAERRQARVEQERATPRTTEAGPMPHLPPSRQRTSAAAPETTDTSWASLRSTSEGLEPDLHSYVSHPLQLVEGKTLLYDPRDVSLWPLMVQLQGWSLELGMASVWGGGNQREAEAFSAACGFSAAWGPMLLKRVATAVYGKVFASGVSVLSTDHVIYAFGQFWDRAIAPFDATERFFRLVKVGGGFAASPGGNGSGIEKVGDIVRSERQGRLWWVFGRDMPC